MVSSGLAARSLTWATAHILAHWGHRHISILPHGHSSNKGITSRPKHSWQTSALAWLCPQPSQSPPFSLSAHPRIKEYGHPAHKEAPTNTNLRKADRERWSYTHIESSKTWSCQHYNTFSCQPSIFNVKIYESKGKEKTTVLIRTLSKMGWAVY